ncbi:MAG: polyprenyl synthetase family protein [Eubacteriales bacterium]|nr:polyprenyl synthetase family protein [Eubacteriales bacterium]
MTGIGDTLKSLGGTVNTRLRELMDVMCEPGILKDAMNYSLTAGGKRLRPALCLMTAGMFGDAARALDFACAIEMIHTYSLIHDDLPAMDNDDLRRGKPTNHVVFTEAYAILAGDGLLNCAFEVMLKYALENKDKQPECIRAMSIIAGASGVTGMIAGQAGDIAFEGKEHDPDVLQYIHTRKTGAMIKASVLSGAVLSGAAEHELSALETYGSCICLTFQIVDDILDEMGDQTRIGKTPGKDAGADKLTFTSVYGIEKSKKIARRQTDMAVKALECFGQKAQTLSALATYLLSRDR